MSRLLALIDDYKDRHGQPSDASIARAIGVAPQTISSWRKRGIRELPESDTLRRLATFIGVPIRTVYLAVGVDANFVSVSDVAEIEPRLRDDERGGGERERGSSAS